MVPIVPGIHSASEPSGLTVPKASFSSHRAAPLAGSLPHGMGSVAWTLCLSDGILLNGTQGCAANNLSSDAGDWDPAVGDLYVANRGTANVSIVNVGQGRVLGSINVGSGPDAVFHDSSRNLFVGNYVSKNLSVIFTGNNLAGSFNIGTAVSSGVYDPDDQRLYFVEPLNNTVKVLDDIPLSLVKNVTVGTAPTSIAFDAADGDLYVTNSGSNNVTVVNGTRDTVLANIPVGVRPSGTTYDPVAKELFVSNQGSDNVTIINGTSYAVVGSVGVGSQPASLAFDSFNGFVYVANQNSGNLTVINATSRSVVGSIPVVGGPSMGVSVDTTNGYVCVENSGAGSVAIIPTGRLPPHYTLSFSETGLPSGFTWSVYVGGYRYTSSQSLLNVSVTNGTYSYVVGTLGRYAVSPTAGNVTVRGAAVTSVSLIFYPISTNKTVSFHETGLPSGTGFGVTLNQTFMNGFRYINFSMANGTYPYSVQDDVGYTETPASGNVTVSGANVMVTVTFIPLPPGVYSVQFQETGLPTGHSWTVLLGSTSLTSTSSSITFSSPNGTENYTIPNTGAFTPAKAKGQVTVNGNGMQEFVYFSPLPRLTHFNVTFTESGLANGVWWYVNLTYSSGGERNTTTNPTIVMYLTNGTYNFTTGTLNKSQYRVSPSTGHLTVNGSSLTESIRFTSNASGSSNPGLGGTSGNALEVIAIVIGVVAAALVVIVVLFLRQRKQPPKTQTPGPT